MTDQHEKVLRGLATQLLLMGTQLEHEDMLREADALTRLLDERENLKELLDYTYHASDCQRMRERAFPERCICGLDELRRELKGE